MTFAVRTYAAPVCFVEPGELADKQIEASIVIVVEPYSLGRPSLNADSGFLSDVAEGPVPIVAKENAATVLRNVEIGESIVVVVADSNSHPESARAYAGFLCDIGERAVPVVLVQCIA